LLIERQSLTVARPTLFWIMIPAVDLLALVLLRPILLPFAVGATLAYLLVPAVGCLELHGNTVHWQPRLLSCCWLSASSTSSW
jgi:predicted PurR-regulated permease PerM